MESSAYYKAQIDKFKGYLGKMAGLSGKVTNSGESSTDSCKFVDKIIICGEPMDGGELSKINDAINSIDSAVSAITGEINAKIEEYTGLYQQALAAEAEAAAAARREAESSDDKPGFKPDPSSLVNV